eukprot:TRINITY_DN39776_c0_g1_i1.p1 TRINITY_DN39776_c0_g1~~TRINITY_DN39776_c0_g1_i1.p1  ORF type:complete len:404 (+),score=85.45 TRINITY_DN39776_c0_g1_i1:30-1214(+)
MVTSGSAGAVNHSRRAAHAPRPLKAKRRALPTFAAAVFVAASLGLRQLFSSGEQAFCLAKSAGQPTRDAAVGRDMETGLASCEWLKAQIDAKASIRIVDATFYLPNSPFAAPEGSAGPQGDFMKGPRIPGSLFFDIDGVVATKEQNPKTLPHMLPDEVTFGAAMAALGIDAETPVVVYDRHGIFSAPRFWWTLKVAFRHQAPVAVLDGGLPRWLELGYAVDAGEEALEEPQLPAKMEAWQRRADAAWDLPQVRANVDAKESIVVDARPAGRFLGQAAEPRPGCRGGHIPGSLNVPFVELMSGPPIRRMLMPAELRQKFLAAGLKESDLSAEGSQKIVTSCGSGLTACLVGLGLHLAGFPLDRWSVYDGSWVEWGMSPDTPIMRQGESGALEAVP